MSSESYVEYVILEYLMSSEFDNIAAGKWVAADKMRDMFLAAVPRSLEKYGYDIGGRYSDIVEFHLSDLYTRKIIIREGDEFTGEFVSFNIDQKDKYLKKIIEGSEVGKRILRLGQEALRSALKTIAEREGWEMEMGRISTPVEFPAGAEGQEIAPASDRIVALDHNSADLVAVQESVFSLRQQLKESNDVGDMQPDEISAAISEIQQIEIQLSAPAVRIDIFQERVRRTLKWISEKAAGAAVGKAALALLAAIATLFGFNS